VIDRFNKKGVPNIFLSVGMSWSSKKKWILDIGKILSKIVKLRKRKGIKRENYIVRLKTYWNSKKERIVVCLNPLSLALSKIMVDYVFFIFRKSRW
jgi:hypothetical protein